jgi:exopolysaccharide production protein ExoZ
VADAVNNKKVLGLELLRGLCALLVAVYHCLTFSDLGHFYTWGLYGVYVFFGISGAVLYANYHATLPSQVSIPQFLWRRFARLAPLLWACILVPAILRNVWVPDHYFLNVSMLQGFASPGNTSYLTGGWSIGIEFVLYALFPTLLALAASTRLMIATLVTLLVLRVAFVNFVLRDSDLITAWGAYTEPAAFLCFFFGGMAIAKWMPLVRIGSHALALIAVGCAAAMFVFPGSSFNDVVLGIRGFALTLLSLLLVAACFWSPRNRVGAAVSRFFGDISYGLYLLHPLAWAGIARYFPALGVEAHIAATLCLSSAAAWLSLKFYETPVRKFLVRRSS